MTRRGRLIVYSGPSGVGKGTLISPLVADEKCSLKMSISATTREPRPGEIDGVHYFFLSKSQFERKIANNEMLEYAEYNGNYYGTPKDFVEQMLLFGKDVVLEIEVQGARAVREKFPDALMVFIMPPSFEELSRRLQTRGTETKESLHSRLTIALSEIAEADHYDFIIVNQDLEQARTQLLKIVSVSDALSRFNHKLIEEVLNDAKTSYERNA